MTDSTTGTALRFGRTTLAAVLGDLLDQPVDAVVIAANQRGVMGAGVAGAIRLAGGRQRLLWQFQAGRFGGQDAVSADLTFSFR
jgi:O-acetyl-ADP-ribose deacetylase (regulator of RNase III)